MNFGLMMTFQNPARWARPFPELYRVTIEHAARAEELGFGEIWLTEHHFDVDGWSPSPMTLAAGVATRTERIRIGTFITILPFQNPVRLAEDIVTADILSNGRLDVGLGKGYRVNEYRSFGIPREERAAIFEENLEVLQRMLSGERFSFEGKYNHLTDIQLSPLPVQRPFPPLWLGARGKKAVQRAARLGYNLMGAGDAATLAYDHALEQANRRPRDFSVAQLRWVYVAETRDRAWDEAGEHLHFLFANAFPMLKEAGDLAADRAMREPPSLAELRKVDPMSPGGFPIIGTADDCTRAIDNYLKTTRVTHLAMGMHLPGLAPDKALRSMELFAREVM
ncbi:MAG: LLM class flavin-dependent oxidoreductase, partial [Candidatus Binataceae bacterium]